MLRPRYFQCCVASERWLSAALAYFLAYNRPIFWLVMSFYDEFRYSFCISLDCF